MDLETSEAAAGKHKKIWVYVGYKEFVFTFSGRGMMRGGFGNGPAGRGGNMGGMMRGGRGLGGRGPRMGLGYANRGK